MSGAYYNEHDPFAAAWLRELIKGGHIADGEVDERSIVDVRGDDLRGFVQCHFFAGIGGWSYALRLAGWPDDRPVWTGSCPCQPFSAAGKGDGAADSRHLWPTWFRLLAECRPAIVFGEQVASVDGLAWLDRVSTDLEGANYAIGAADLCAAGVGAPHIRQRLWFVAHAEQRAAERHRYEVAGAASRAEGAAQERQRLRADAGDGGAVGGMADTQCDGGRAELAVGQAQGRDVDGRDCARLGGMDDATSPRHASALGGESLQHETRCGVPGVGCAHGELGHAECGGCESGHADGTGADQPGAARDLDGPWHHAIFIPCGDGKARPIEPGLEPLAYGLPARVGRLRGYGNAINPQTAARFILAADAAMRAA